VRAPLGGGNSRHSIGVLLSNPLLKPTTRFHTPGRRQKTDTTTDTTRKPACSCQLNAMQDVVCLKNPAGQRCASPGVLGKTLDDSGLTELLRNPPRSLKKVRNVLIQTSVETQRENREQEW